MQSSGSIHIDEKPQANNLKLRKEISQKSKDSSKVKLNRGASKEESKRYQTDDLE